MGIEQVFQTSLQYGGRSEHGQGAACSRESVDTDAIDRLFPALLSLDLHGEGALAPIYQANMARGGVHNVTVEVLACRYDAVSYALLSTPPTD